MLHSLPWLNISLVSIMIKAELIEAKLAELIEDSSEITNISISIINSTTLKNLTAYPKILVTKY